jgi:eukaryotic-like serine/threonine-protein kinase
MRSIAEGMVVNEKYRLEREIASGGMGALWLAFDLTLKRHVVVKFIQTQARTDAHMKARFEREARAAAQIRSPNVIATYDYGVDRGCAFIVMEHLEGEDLKCRLDRDGKLSVVHTLTMLRQLGKGLDAVHAAGIIHRDLKPGNIFLAVEGEEEVVKLLDFGVAKAMMSGTIDKLTMTGVIIGTTRYMSPEQTKGSKQVDYRTDLWAAAVIVYRALTGVFPFNGQTTSDIIDSICRKPIPRASELAPELPCAIDSFFERAMARDPNDRFQSGKEMANALFNAMQEPLPESIGALSARASQRAAPPRDEKSDVGTDTLTIAAGVDEAQALPARRDESFAPTLAEQGLPTLAEQGLAPGPLVPSRDSLAPTLLLQRPPQNALVCGAEPVTASVPASNPIDDKSLSETSYLPPFTQTKWLHLIIAAVVILVLALLAGTWSRSRHKPVSVTEYEGASVDGRY